MAKPRSKQASTKKGKKPAAPATPATHKRTPDRPPAADNSPDMMSRDFRLSRDSDVTSTQSESYAETSDTTPIQSPTASQSHIRSIKRRPGPKSTRQRLSLEDDENDMSEYPTPETSFTDQSELRDDEENSGAQNGDANDEENNGGQNGVENLSASTQNHTRKSIKNVSRRKQDKPRSWSKTKKLALEMARLQVSTGLLVQKASFQR